jgi:hypothetical protein
MTEASYYGVYASGHPELARLYWAPMIDGMPAARRGAVDRAKAHNLSNCAPTALHYNAHISPWGFGDFDEDWESNSVPIILELSPEVSVCTELSFPY